MPFAALPCMPQGAPARKRVAGARQQARSRLRRRVPDLAVVFFSAHHADKAVELATELQQRLTPGAGS